MLYKSMKMHYIELKFFLEKLNHTDTYFSNIFFF